MRYLVWLILLGGFVPLALADDAGSASTTATTSSTTRPSSTDPSSRLRIQPVHGPAGAGIKMTPVGGTVKGAGVKTSPANTAHQQQYQIKKVSELHQTDGQPTTNTTGGSTTATGLPHYQIKRMTAAGATVKATNGPGSIGLPSRSQATTGNPPTTNSPRVNATPLRGSHAIGGTRTETTPPR